MYERTDGPQVMVKHSREKPHLFTRKKTDLFFLLRQNSIQNRVLKCDRKCVLYCIDRRTFGVVSLAWALKDDEDDLLFERTT